MHSLYSKIITHLEFKIYPTKKYYFDPTTTEDKSFRRLLIRKTRYYLDYSRKRQGYFSNFTLIYMSSLILAFILETEGVQ